MKIGQFRHKNNTEQHVVFVVTNRVALAFTQKSCLELYEGVGFLTRGRFHKKKVASFSTVAFVPKKLFFSCSVFAPAYWTRHTRHTDGHI